MGRSDIISLSPIKVIHPKVDLVDIQSNGKLLSDEQIAMIKKRVARQERPFQQKTSWFAISHHCFGGQLFCCL